MSTRTVRSVAGSSVAALSLLTGATGAGADDVTESPGAAPPSPPPRTVTADALAAGTTRADQVAGDAKARVDEFLATEARAGRPHDRRALNHITADLGEGLSVATIIGVDDTIGELVTFTGPESPVTAFGAEIINTGGAATEGSVGFDAGWSDNSTRQKQVCRPFWFASTMATYDHYVYDCYEKWKSNTDGSTWAYNRYTLFDPASPPQWSSVVYKVKDATIRTRPAAAYRSRIIGGVYDYEPKPSYSSCPSSMSVSFGPLSIGLGGFNCGPSIEVFPRSDTGDAWAYSMGTDWDGETSNQVGIDYAFAIKTNGSEPIYADYLWMEILRCERVAGCVPWAESRYYQWVESGW